MLVMQGKSIGQIALGKKTICAAGISKHHLHFIPGRPGIFMLQLLSFPSTPAKREKIESFDRYKTQPIGHDSNGLYSGRISTRCVKQHAAHWKKSSCDQWTAHPKFLAR